jgi:uncharacterized protein YndB with AHSA1/START domain
MRNNKSMKKLTIERTFNHPIEKVWAAWTTPELLAQWFTPTGMTNTLATADVEVGGLFRYCFKSVEDGKEYYGRGRYHTITPMTRLSYYDSFTDETGADVPASHYGAGSDQIEETLVDIRFEDLGEQTKMTIEMENPYVDDEKMTEDMTAGWNSMFDKLANLP